jgi:uncharacterized protein YkwD
MNRRAAILLVSSALMTGACVSFGSNRDGLFRVPANVEAFRRAHLDEVNALRAQSGLGPLIVSEALNTAATVHARDMSAQRRAWNFGSDRSSPQSRAQRSGFFGLVTGENVAETYQSDMDMRRIWMTEPRSRAAILSGDATHLGLGWHQDSDGKMWWVQMTAAETRQNFGFDPGAV